MLGWSRLVVLVALFSATAWFPVADVAGQAVVTVRPAASRNGVTLLPVQGNVYVVQGAGANITVQIGTDGVVLVDAGSGDKTADVLALIADLTREPIRYIINTGPSADHVGGNEQMAAAGRSLAGRGRGRGLPPGAAPLNAAPIVGPEQLIGRMNGRYPAAAWPTEAFLEGEAKNVYLNDEAIQVIYQPKAHSDSDSVVLFRRSDVVVTGEIFDMTRFPVIDVASGGSIDGEIAALNQLIRLVIPSMPLPFKDGGTRVIPARGRIGEQAEVVEYRDMVAIIRDRVQALIDQKKTLAEIQTANPAVGFRGRFGADSGPWTTAMFIEAIHRSLTSR